MNPFKSILLFCKKKKKICLNVRSYREGMFSKTKIDKALACRAISAFKIPVCLVRILNAKVAPSYVRQGCCALTMRYLI
jgi:hypothetical protein